MRVIWYSTINNYKYYKAMDLVGNNLKWYYIGLGYIGYIL